MKKSKGLLSQDFFVHLNSHISVDLGLDLTFLIIAFNSLIIHICVINLLILFGKCVYSSGICCYK